MINLWSCKKVIENVEAKWASGRNRVKIGNIELLVYNRILQNFDTLTLACWIYKLFISTKPDFIDTILMYILECMHPYFLLNVLNLDGLIHWRWNHISVITSNQNLSDCIRVYFSKPIHEFKTVKIIDINTFIATSSDNLHCTMMWPFEHMKNLFGCIISNF